MFKELLDYLLYRLKSIVSSRLFPVAAVFLLLFGLLFRQMYKLQIVEGEEAEKSLQTTTVRSVSTSPTRGNIYDRNGELLAYNKLVQNITVIDDGTYPSGYERNHMLLELIDLLDRHGETVEPSIPLYFDEEGQLQESFTSENARLRFLRDMYGKKSISELTEEQAASDSRTILDYYIRKFGVGTNADKTTYEVPDETALKLVYIRYAMYLKYYTRYNAVTVSSDVKDETVAAIREHAARLPGVDVAEDYIRAYNDAQYFCHIIGYTGQASAEEIEALNANGGSYSAGDTVGKTGIEDSCELYLHGTSGYVSMYVNNFGQIQKVIEVVDAVAGDDIYLSIDAELQKACYHLIEQKLAGTLVAHLKNEDVDPGEADHYIPIKQAYFQLINNNVLDRDSFFDEDAGEAEKRLAEIYSAAYREVMEDVEEELLSFTPRSYAELSEEERDYFDALYQMLLDRSILIRANIDSEDPIYTAYRKDGSVSLQAYLKAALEKGWIDVTKLDLSAKYTGAEQVYRELISLILTCLEDSGSFAKEIFEHLIYSEAVNRCDIALALFEQGILRADESWQTRLATGSDRMAFDFMVEKINNIELTPAQLALDPYSASATVVDISTGKVLAMVSYPGYDNNRMSDPAYYNTLLNDQSTPLFNSATQAKTAPGSIFKVVTTAATMENGIIDENTYIHTVGKFTGAGMEVRCWCYPASHGDINVTQALRFSCNDFFCQMGYRLGLVDGVYYDTVGIDKIREYATLLGLGSKSGVEVTEYAPEISTTSSITSAIGQGTHLFAGVQLARYVTTVATRGTVYSLTLLDHRTDAEGNLAQSYRGEMLSKTDLADNTWDAMQTGMHLATTVGSTAWVFSKKVDIAGKTGTAEENGLRPNHATFISFAPYSNPEITVTVTIPHGYTSGNTAELGGYIYDYYYGYITYEDVISGHARDAGGNTIYN